MILDSNVLLAAFATHGLCHGILELCRESHTILAGEELLGEVAKHLSGKFKMPEPRARDIVKFLRESAILLSPHLVAPEACRDCNDLHVLGLAVAGRADTIVTGDKDLLVLRKFHGTTIQSPREFWEQIRTENGSQS